MRILVQTYDQSVNDSLRALTPGERKFLVDIFNATALTPGLLGDHLLAQVEDSFAVAGEDYERKWGIEREALLAKLRALTPWQRGCLEVWANTYWYGSPGADPPDLDEYIDGGPGLSIRLDLIDGQLRRAIELMGDSRHAFKSQQIADARARAEAALSLLRGEK